MRSRTRRRIIRIRINEPRIRTIIRITAEQNATTSDNLIYFSFNHQIFALQLLWFDLAFHAASICGKKQSREPKCAAVRDGELSVAAQTNPAYAP